MSKLEKSNMQRREFLRDTLLIAGSGVILSCEDKTAINKERKFEGRVAIIGAGVAGLYAGYLLEQNGNSYTIFEASDQIGGRIRSIKGLADFDIELGAEFIHGKRSIWHDWAKESGATLISVDNFLDYFQISNNLRNENQWATNTDFKAAQAVVNQATNYNGGNDISLTQLIDNAKLPQSVRHIVEAQVANEAGAPPNILSMKGITEEAQTWSAGEENLISANKSFASIISSKCQAVIPKVKLNTAIKKIEYGINRDVMIEDSQAQRYYFDKLIVTVPITILKGDVQFTPPLPDDKLTAIKNIGMSAGMKITLVFNQRLWAADATSIYTAGAVPEFIVSSLGRSTQSFVLSGFVTGSKAENLTKLTNAAIIQAALADLDTVFGNKIATNSLTNARVTDWTKEPYVKGAYSYPLVGGGGLLTRQTLASPLLKQVYFAGEATHYGGHSGTVHGAMESAKRAVEELLKDAV